MPTVLPDRELPARAPRDARGDILPLAQWTDFELRKAGTPEATQELETRHTARRAVNPEPEPSASGD